MQGLKKDIDADGVDQGPQQDNGELSHLVFQIRFIFASLFFRNNQVFYRLFLVYIRPFELSAFHEILL